MIDRRTMMTASAATLMATALPAETASALPKPVVFLRLRDHTILEELEAVQRTLEEVKAGLLLANLEAPIVRGAVLFDMRCRFEHVRMSTEFLRDHIQQQKAESDAASREYLANGGQN